MKKIIPWLVIFITLYMNENLGAQSNVLKTLSDSNQVSPLKDVPQKKQEEGFEIFFPNGVVTSLQHANYYGDKPNFWYYYQSWMDAFCKDVCLWGTPVKVMHVHEDRLIEFKSEIEFRQWFAQNQPGIKPCTCFGEVNHADSIYLKAKVQLLRMDHFFENIKSSGGFKKVDGYTSRSFGELSRIVAESLASIEKLEQSSSLPLDSELIAKFKQAFSIPKTKLVENYDLASYLHVFSKDANVTTLNALCEINHQHIKTALGDIEAHFQRIKK